MSDMMDNQSRLSAKRRISAMQFACWELHLFLDTHPNNCDAAKRMEEYRARLSAAVKEYEDKYGPLGETSQNTSRWEWINAPWPWQMEDD